jgi:hypothetical protein
MQLPDKNEVGLYHQAAPTCQNAIAIVNEPQVGAHVLRVGIGSQNEPSFKTVLSAGDKFTLALTLQVMLRS